MMKEIQWLMVIILRQDVTNALEHKLNRLGQ